MTLDRLNTAPPDVAAQALRACCGSSRWLNAFMAQRPFATHAALLAANDAAWHATGPNDWREAMASHPRIGEKATGKSRSHRWSEHEQSGVGVNAANRSLRAALARANGEYEARFGHIFIVCASGKSGAELLATVRDRLRNTAATELAIAGNELRKIARLRLEKLLGVPPTEVVCT